MFRLPSAPSGAIAGSSAGRDDQSEVRSLAPQIKRTLIALHQLANDVRTRFPAESVKYQTPLDRLTHIVHEALGLCSTVIDSHTTTSDATTHFSNAQMSLSHISTHIHALEHQVNLYYHPATRLIRAGAQTWPSPRLLARFARELKDLDSDLYHTYGVLPPPPPSSP